ncbi:probable cysteine--tRNA ligase, mitochondrial isoform X2 [Daktulosphaira vitifoliae]|nr:probable cysteine--tRNA ligase, mitochondrial isoform X2 [Daktulosphaira vitifoliae]XP_050527501.1 probable cysteine--tRNA ligase, mitochondrial isoform X2 [Daktulosphaira vitifoliae]
MNVTDIDDKIISKAQVLGQDPIQISRKYEKEFLEDMLLLNIKHPNIVARVTDFIPEIKCFIKNLMDKNLSYCASDGTIFFDTIKYKKYGKFLKTPDKVPHILKKVNSDFALWKAAKLGEPSWDSYWGRGRPGWHIECSVIASYYFGSNVDIHSGGIDLLFPHHENEEAQCCAFHNVDNWVNHWIYTGHLHLGNNIKMSKSLKNTIGIKELLKSYTANEFRVLCLLSNYKNDVEFSEKSMEVATNVLKKLKSFIFNCSNHIKTKQVVQIEDTNLLYMITDTENKIIIYLADNFDTSKVLQSLINLVSKFNKLLNKDFTFNCSISEIVLASNLVSNTLHNFGINLSELKNQTSLNSDLIIDCVVNFRGKLRQLALKSNSKISNQEILQLCDELRNELSFNNITIQDSSNLSVWKYTGTSPEK